MLRLPRAGPTIQLKQAAAKQSCKSGARVGAVAPGPGLGLQAGSWSWAPGRAPGIQLETTMEAASLLEPAGLRAATPNCSAATEWRCVSAANLTS